MRHNDRETEYGPERQCSKCREWWFRDEEFFHRIGGYLRNECRACANDRRNAKRVPAAVSVPVRADVALRDWLVWQADIHGFSRAGSAAAV